MTDTHREISDRAFEKLQKLIRHEQSARAIGSLAEADAFAGMIQAMLDKYHIALADVSLAEQPVDPVIHSEDGLANDGLPHYKHRVGWLETLARGVAEGNYCRFVLSRRSSRVTFAGHRSDVVICDYLFNTLAHAGLRLSKEKAEAARKSGAYDRSFTSEFLYGYASSIHHRLVNSRRKQDAGHTSSVTALVHNREANVEQFCKEQFEFVTSPYLGPSCNNLNAYEDGLNAGRKASIPSGGINAGRPNRELTSSE